jgi:peptidoglycan/xylan/chitin deacetylase (PgdA/CDA1 family)
MTTLVKPSWPPGTICGVTVTVNFDAESVDLHEVESENLFGRFSYGRYGMRAGIWRLLEVLKAHDVKGTFFVPALDAENNRPAVEAVLKHGHEIAARGYAFEDHSKLGDKEKEILAKAHEALTRATGACAKGWRAPKGLLSPETLNFLAELDYLYDSSFQDDDFPYIMACLSGRPIVELPCFQFLDDSTLYEPRHTHNRVLKTWIEEFDAIYSEGGFVNLTLHARGDYGSGRASRVRVVDEFLLYMRRRPGIVFMTCQQMASLWKQIHPQMESAPT